MTSAFAAALAGHLLSFAGAVVLFALGWLVGDGVLRRIPLPPLSRLERELVSAGLGLGMVAIAAFLAGVAGFYTAWGLRGLLTVALAAGLLLRAGGAPVSDSSADAGLQLPRWSIAVGVLAALLLVGLLPSVLTPMVDHDGLAYHVGAPKRWLELGRIAYLPTHLHTLWPMGEEMLNALLLATVGDRGFKPLMFLFALFGAAATYAVGQRLAGRPVGVLAAAVLMVRAGAPSINTTSVEMPLTCFVVLAALLLAVRGATGDAAHRRSLLVLSALMAGVACAVKLNGLLCLVFLAVAIIVLDRRQKVATSLSAAAAYVAIALACATPWYFRAWWITGNPIFPFGYGLLDGRNWSVEAARNLAAYFRTFDLPGDDIAARAAFVQRHLVKLAVMLTAGLALPGSPRWVRGLILGAGLFAIIQAITSDNPRFLLPLTPFAAIAIAWWLARVAEKWPMLGWVWVAAIAWFVVPSASRELTSMPPVVWGGQTREDFIVYYVNNRPAFEWANVHLPAGARVLYGPDNRTYYLQREVYWSCALYQREIDFRTPETFRASLRQAGIHWLILNRDVYKDYAISFETNMGWRADEKVRLVEAASTGKLRYSVLGVEVYELP